MPEEMLATGTETAGTESAAIGGTESTETTVEQTTEGAETTEQTEETTEGGEQTTEAQPIGQSQFLAHVEELKKTNPALAKELKNLYFANKAFKEAVPGGLPAVKEALATIEDLGGAEGIAKLREEKAEWTQIDDQFAAGDPRVLDTFAQFNPEGFAKIIPAALDRLPAIDKAAYDHALAGPFVATLDSWRFADQLERLYDDLAAVVDKDNKPLLARQMERLQGLYKQYTDLRDLAAKAPERKNAGADTKLSQRETELAQRESQFNAQRVSAATETYAQKAYGTLIPAEAKNQGLNLEQLRAAESYDRFQSEIDEEIGRTMAQDAATYKKIQASIAAGRLDEAIKLSNSKFDAVKGQAIKKVVQRWARLTNPTRKAAAGTGKTAAAQQAIPAGVKKLDGPPDLSLVDQKDENWRTDYMMHSKAKLKTGQRVQW